MRIIDEKFAIEGDRIFSRRDAAPIPDDEPVFILRARDVVGLPLLRVYRIMCKLAGCSEDQLSSLATRKLVRFRDFAEDHPDRMKLPEAPREDR